MTRGLGQQICVLKVGSTCGYSYSEGRVHRGNIGAIYGLFRGGYGLRQTSGCGT